MGTFAQNFTIVGPYGQPAPLSTGGVQGIATTSTTQNYNLGTVVTAVDPVLGPAEFVYCVGVAATAVGDPIQINADYTTVRAVGGTAFGHIGVAMSACVASNYGWYCIKGRVLVTIAADVAAAARASIVSAVWSNATTATKQIIGASLAIGLDAGGSAIVGTTDTTAAHKTIAFILYPQAANYV
jgi:hypothetical protein